ncbi:octanoyltransferase [bacterium]|nr:octanoyltransferase [bacterium]
MARDLALFEALEAGEPGAPPTLRLYAWRPWAVSLGSHQEPARALDLAALAARGYDWVRRPTGGRAVLPADENTYALAAPLAGPFAAGLASTHRRIAAALARFYRGLGLSVALTRPAPPALLDPRSPAPCFAAPGLAELAVAGRKLAGSAQRRGRRAFLQHGSLPLGPAHLELALLLPLDPAARLRYQEGLAAQTVSLGELLPALPPRESLEAALAAAFAEEFAVVWLGA